MNSQTNSKKMSQIIKNLSSGNKIGGLTRGLPVVYDKLNYFIEEDGCQKIYKTEDEVYIIIRNQSDENAALGNKSLKNPVLIWQK